MSMKQGISIFALAVCLTATFAQAQTGLRYDPKPGPGAGKHIVFLSGDEEYRSEEGLPMLAKILSQRHGFTCTVLFAQDADGTINPNNNTSLPGAEVLDRADGIVMLLRFRAWPDEAMKHFVDAVQRGVPIVALRTSTHAFRFPANSSSSYKSWSDKGPDSFGKKILGEEWINPWGANRQGATRGIVELSAKDDPILRGVSDVFGDSGVYEVHPPADAKILLRGQVLKGMNPADPPSEARKAWRFDGQQQGMNDPMMALAWTRAYVHPSGKLNKVFCTTAGAASDLQNEGLRRLIINAVYWGIGLDPQANADVNYVDPFTPTAYSMGGFRKGMTPADHALGKAYGGATSKPVGGANP